MDAFFSHKLKTHSDSRLLLSLSYYWTWCLLKHHKAHQNEMVFLDLNRLKSAKIWLKRAFLFNHFLAVHFLAFLSLSIFIFCLKKWLSVHLTSKSRDCLVPGNMQIKIIKMCKRIGPLFPSVCLVLWIISNKAWWKGVTKVCLGLLKGLDKGTMGPSSWGLHCILSSDNRFVK